MPRQDSLSKVLHTLTSLTSSHILRHLPGWFYDSPTVCVQLWTQAAVWRCTAGINHGDPIKRKEPPFVRMPLDGVTGEPRGVWVQLLKTVHGLADGTRESGGTVSLLQPEVWFEISVLEPSVLVLRNTQQKYHGIVGVAVDDIAGGGDEVWEQAISKLKQRFTFGHWEVGKGKCCSREVV